MRDLAKLFASPSSEISGESFGLRSSVDCSSRIPLLTSYVKQETELKGCCFIDVTFPSQALRIAVDMRGNGATLVLGAPGQLWIRLNPDGSTLNLLKAQGLQTLNIDISTREKAEHAVDMVMAAIQERGRFVSIDEVRREQHL